MGNWPHFAAGRAGLAAAPSGGAKHLFQGVCAQQLASPSVPSPLKPGRTLTERLTPRSGNSGRNLIARSFTDSQSHWPSRAPHAQGNQRDRLLRGLNSLPTPKKLFSSLQAKLAPATINALAPADGKPSTITSHAPETIFKKQNAEQLRISYVSHHNDSKGKLIGKFIGMAFKRPGADKQAVYSRHVESVQHGGPDLDKIKQMLRNDDVVVLEGNLGHNGANVWPYPRGFFNDTKAKVLVSAGEADREVVHGMNQLHEVIGDRLLTKLPAKHTDMNGKGLLTPTFASAMLAPLPPAGTAAQLTQDDTPATPTGQA